MDNTRCSGGSRSGTDLSPRHPPARRLAAALALIIAVGVMLVACSSETTPAGDPTALPAGTPVAGETVAETPVTGDRQPSIEQETPAATFTPQPAPAYTPVPTLTPPVTPRQAPTATPLPAFTPVPSPAQPLALVVLYHATGGPNWNDNTNWLSAAPLDEWYGVSTDNEGRVIGLFLANNRLSGEIPPQLGDFANLEALDLRGNQLSGPIPAELGSLASLELLSLNGNELSGNIPPQLANLDGLTELYLANNRLSGEIPPQLGDFANLEALDLRGNQLSGPIPAELGSLASLELLSLNGNELSGNIPPQLANLDGLTELYLANNRLSGEIPPQLGDFANLEWLILGWNQLSGAIPPELGNLLKLIGLDLLGNQLSGAIPPELGSLAKLEFLALNDNQLSGAIPPELGGLASLGVLRLNDNHLSGNIPAELGDLASLEVLRLDGNQLSGCVPSGLQGQLDTAYSNLGGLPFCRGADVPTASPRPTQTMSEREALAAFYNATGGPNWNDNTNWLSGAPLNEWHGVSTDSAGSVIELGLPDNQLTGEIPPELGSLANLEWLGLRGNQLSGAIPPELGSLASLEHLDLGWNQFSGPIPPELGSLANLESLGLNHNRLSGEIPPELGNLANLEILAFNHNQLSGEIPPEIGNLSKLFLLLLDENQLSGEIPPELGNLLKLIGLHLSGNRLSGEIPPELGNLANLGSLDLNDNRLSGEIPPELGSLSGLELVNLSNNRLAGAIPAELGRLTNLTSLFLNGNDLTGEIPPVLGNLPGLEILHLHFNKLTGEIPPELSNLAGLRELDLGVNSLSGEIPPGLGALSNLTSLWLGWNDLSGEIPPELGSLGNLTRLWVNDNRLEGCLPGSLAGQLDDLSNVGDVQFCEDISLQSSSQEDADESRTAAPPDSGLAEYADRHAHGPGAVYAGDLAQLAGPAPSPYLGDSDGNVSLAAVKQYSWLFESGYYRELLEKANLTDPTPLTSRGHSIEIYYACINNALLSCRLAEEFWAPNLEERTNGQLTLEITSLAKLGLPGADTLKLVSDGTLDMTAVYSGYIARELPIFDILDLYGLYPDHRTLFESTTEILPTLDAVLAEGASGGIVASRNWFFVDEFLFSQAPLRSPADFEGLKIRSRSANMRNWLEGMGAQAEFVAFAEVYDALEEGDLDAGVTNSWAAHGQRWYEVTGYMNGPLINWVPLPNLLNPDVWRQLPADLQKILIEEGARTELEQFRLAPAQILASVRENIDAGLEPTEFSSELEQHSFNIALMEHVIPAWLRRLGYPARGLDAVALFNDSAGPYVGLRIEPDGTVVKGPITKGPNAGGKGE